MSKERRGMILASIILSFIAAGALLIVGIVGKLNVDIIYNALINWEEEIAYINPDVVANVLLILSIVVTTLICCGNALLFVSIANKGKNFKQRKNIFIAGSVLVILTGVTNIYSILLFVAIFMKERETLNVQNATFSQVQEPTPVQEKDVKDQINELKKMRDQGIITEEELQQMLMKLI